MTLLLNFPLLLQPPAEATEGSFAHPRFDSVVFSHEHYAVDMDAVHRLQQPNLRRPHAVIAFEGWNDACNAASGAINYILEHYSVENPFAVIEPDEFFDFQAHRPELVLNEQGVRSLSWPDTRLYAIELPDEEQDLIVVIGEEPSYRWKTYCRSILSELANAGVEQIVLLGAFVGEVAHTKPVPMTSMSTDPEMICRFHLTESRYEGPTGIVGVLLEACREEGLAAVSLWAATPHYLAANPYPKAMLALTKKAGEVLEMGFDTSELETIVHEYLDRVSVAVAANNEFSTYLAKLEKANEGPAPSQQRLDPTLTHELIGEIEDFLREQG